MTIYEGLRCRDGVARYAALVQKIVEALKDGLELVDRSGRHCGAAQALGLLLEGSIEQPVVVRADVAQVHEAFEPVGEKFMGRHAKGRRDGRLYGV